MTKVPESIGRSLSFLYRKSLVYKNEQLKNIGLTAAEQPFMCALYLKDGVSQESLSTYLSIDKAATTRIIQSLLKKGYVTKEKDSHDRRMNRITLTPSGQALKPKLMAILKDFNEIMTQGMSEEAKSQTYQALEKMSTNLDQYLKERNDV